jgi:hypothetical protein
VFDATPQSFILLSLHRAVDFTKKPAAIAYLCVNAAFCGMERVLAMMCSE